MRTGINNNAKYKFNSKYDNYTYMYYSNSEVKPTLESWYQTNIGSKADLAKYVASGNYYCEQARVKRESNYVSGNVGMKVYTNYTPDFKCATDGNGKGLVNSNIGLITYDEVIYAGGYYEKTNSYYLNVNKFFMTMSPAGNLSGSFSFIWYVKAAGSPNSTQLYDTYVLLPVINLKADTVATGSGTSSDPFIVK